MPHLSPMNWILAILMFWLILLTMSSKLWWSSLTTMPFKLPLNLFSTKKGHQWKW